MLAYAVLAVLAVATLDQTFPVAGRQLPLSVITLIVLGMFAFRTWLHHKRELLESAEAEKTAVQARVEPRA
jgi:hypothetical protein